jgi:colicin import membrane protein
VVAKQKVEE